MGAYADAWLKVEGGKWRVESLIGKFKFHLNEGCIGSVSEIFDADRPHHSRGCIAQAWGVAELLRVIKEYQLAKTQEVKMKNQSVVG